MDAAAILSIVSKGVDIAEQVWENRDLAWKAIQSVQALLSKTVPTAAEVTQTETDLDALLAEFNAPLPPDAD